MNVSAVRPFALFLVLLGLFALGVTPGSIYQPHYGEEAYDFGVEPFAGTPPEDAVVAYEDLPAAAQEAFDEAQPSGYATMWVDERESNESVRALDSHEYVRYRGEYYRLVAVHADRINLGPTVGYVFTILGGTILAFGLLALYFDSLRPLTPLRSLLVPAVPILWSVSLWAYDLFVAPPKSADLPFWPLFVGLTVVGSCARRGRHALAFSILLGIVALSVVRRPGHPGFAPVTDPLMYGLPWLILGIAATKIAAPPVRPDNS
jgi:hypothetical protein